MDRTCLPCQDDGGHIAAVRIHARRELSTAQGYGTHWRPRRTCTPWPAVGRARRGGFFFVFLVLFLFLCSPKRNRKRTWRCGLVPTSIRPARRGCDDAQTGRSERNLGPYAPPATVHYTSGAPHLCV